MGVFVYADESGHSGRNIFDEKSPTYFQGAIISLGDVDPIINGVVQRHCQALSVPRLHSNQHQEHVVSIICADLLDALEKTPWEFSLCVIHKPYLAPTKFVDLFFDSGDNPAVPVLWYNTELFRHAMCLGMADLLSEEDNKAFWDGYLSDDMPKMLQVAENALSRIGRISDPRMKEVMADGLTYAISHPDEFTLICTNGKSAYKGQTPNMVAFSSLMAATHSFCKKHSSSVKELIHDRSDEFRGTMREYHRIFHKTDHVEDEFGGPILFEEAQFNLGKFDLRSSESHPALQAVDVFLWMVQRDLVTEHGQKTLVRLRNHLCDFVISPAMSQLIVKARTYQLNSKPISSEEIKAGRKFSAQLEARRQKRLSK
ncbi:DUF3800 domain-containing protein [Serratia ficaria]|uniref:DUF3800 domain-containing protein n=1 Tax=Serratia ficaria TaxID=61651 RepID=UPI00217A098B|nr:DUF3800 domain-containing protein [Serratia ficaria]CAI2128067.1 Uncharacterised protein [Serratia ficaria]